MENNLSIDEIENLSYYDFMGYLGVPFFQIGGLESTGELARLSHIEAGKKVLIVGCGTGFNAGFIAKKFGCHVTGVDISEKSIKKAQERSIKEKLQDSVEFRVGDAYDLPFGPESFDAVMTEFVSQFLDLDRAFFEFVRVLRPGGYVGINEMFKDADVPEKIGSKILTAEEIISDITKLPFRIHTPEYWKRGLEKVGLTDVEIHENKKMIGLGESPEIIREIGGFWMTFRMMIRFTKYYILSKKIRERFKKLNKAKRVLVGSPMFPTKTSKHVGYILGVGKKG
jgi:ubiquinone/menaquinone biosynthesis C-methylase UbiE